MSEQSQTASDTKRLEEVLRELLSPARLPLNVKSARYELGTDHIGEPAVRIYLEIESAVATALEKDKAQRDELSKFRQNLTKQILELESGYFPFIRLAEAA
ncbi:MAG: hypothetical protein WBE76_07160 [Terracidiphilus sp.]